MPHLILDGHVDLARVTKDLPREVRRWGTAVLKTEEVWMRSDNRALLVEGVVVENSRAIHPVALVASGGEETSVRLWRHVAVERTAAVQRWLAVIARDLRHLGGGPLRITNLADEVVAGLALDAED